MRCGSKSTPHYKTHKYVFCHTLINTLFIYHFLYLYVINKNRNKFGLNRITILGFRII